MIKLNGNVIEQNNFPDKTLLMKFDEFLLLDQPVEIEIEWRYESDAELFSLICLKRHLDEVFGKRVCLFMPYIPHARMDRVKSVNDVFTLKYFCEVINSLNFYEVVVYDAHSNVSLALLNNVIELHPQREIGKVLEELPKDVLMFYPDEGAMKRYSSSFVMPYAFGLKDRDWSTGVIKGLKLVNEELVKDKDVLIVDDICSRGGTFYHSAKALKAAGAKNIYLYVSHCEETVLDGDLYKEKLVEKIFTFDPLGKLLENDKDNMIKVIK